MCIRDSRCSALALPVEQVLVDGVIVIHGGGPVSYTHLGVPSAFRELPFLESLLTFLEMDCGELIPALQRIADGWNRLITEDDREAGTDAMVELGQLKSRHIYLELLYVRWYDRFSRMRCV